MPLTRRDFLKATGAGVLAMVGAGAGWTAGTDEARPNIIFILADQLRYASCGYAGDTAAQTPNLDRLAASGVNFRQAVSSMPVCSAYRASLFTGKYTSSTGMVINELRMNTRHTCLGHCLTRAGYETGYIGKWHLYANELGNHSDPKNSFVPRGPDRLGFDGYWAAYNFHHEYYGAYYHTETPEKVFFPKGGYEPDGQTDLAIDYLRRTGGKGKPFFLMVSYGTPHNPWAVNNVPKAYLDRFRDTPFPPPANYAEEMDPYGDAWSNMRHTAAQVKEWKRIYYAMAANLDWNVGRLLEALEQAGLADNTLVVFSSDHGEMFGAHGRMNKNTFHEEAARIPFLMRWPRRIPKGAVSDVCLNTVDIMPTLLSMAGIDIPKEVEGVDLSRAAAGKGEEGPEYAFLMNTGACAAWENGHEWRALRSPQVTYAVFRGCPERKLPPKTLLFDNQADPLQMRNLADEPGHEKQRAELDAKLKAKMASLKDTFPESTWYRDHWIKNRIIQCTATLPPA